MTFRDFKKERPPAGTRILAFSPVYPDGDPMRFRMVTVLPVGMDEVVSYATEADLEFDASIDLMVAVKRKAGEL